ncbi:MAG: sensor domain-containing diguanylate cyclase [Nitrosomonas sp.]|nr:MAG: sensor domain-containing diguanylate cyclase [Nitrosomonas sp.]
MMNESVYEKNRELQRKLDHLLKQARANEKKQQLYETLGFEIIGASTPTQLRELLLTQIIIRLQLLDVVLCLVDYDKDTQRMFFEHDEETRLGLENKLLILDTQKHADLIRSLPVTPLLGVEALKRYPWITANLETKNQIKSTALLPLVRSRRITGALMLLSHNPHRYQADIGTLFLQKLSAMAAVAIENCLNQQRIKEASYQDALTQAYNRRYFDLRFKDEIARCMRWDDDLTCMFLDVDHFKNINDTYGHQTGDLVLKHMVNLIKEQVRSCDIVARYGGEEFVIVLPSTALQAAREIAERLRQAIYSSPVTFCDQQLHATVSIGMTSLKDLHTVQHDVACICSMLLDRADKALYIAKENGRNQVALFINPITSA